jgi:hypothetical protein
LKAAEEEACLMGRKRERERKRKRKSRGNRMWGKSSFDIDSLFKTGNEIGFQPLLPLCWSVEVSGEMRILMGSSTFF